MNSNGYTVKDSFSLVEETVEQGYEFFIGSLGVDFLFTFNIEETTDIGTNKLFLEIERVVGLSTAIKESYFVFNGKPRK